MRRASILLTLLSLGCAGDPTPTGPTGQDRPMAARPNPAPTGPDPADPAPGDERDLARWSDRTAGPEATLVYVTRAGGRGKVPQPAALVFSSDPTNGHFRRETTHRITVHRLYRKEMAALLGRLEQRGLRALPWRPQPYDAEIGPERALLLYEDGERRRVTKDDLPPSDRATFTELEQALIELTLGR